MPVKVSALQLPLPANAQQALLFKQLTAWSTQVNAVINGLGTNPAAGSGNAGSGLTTLTVSGTNATIAIASFAHFVSGTGSLATIEAPAGFSGVFYLIPLSEFTINGAGNIALSTAFQTQVNQMVTMVYDGSHWYAS